MKRKAVSQLLDCANGRHCKHPNKHADSHCDVCGLKLHRECSLSDWKSTGHQSTPPPAARRVNLSPGSKKVPPKKAPKEIQKTKNLGSDSKKSAVGILPSKQEYRCVCGPRCLAPLAKDTNRHRCPGCNKGIHGACGVHDIEQPLPLATSQWCFTCHDARVSMRTAATKTPRPSSTAKNQKTDKKKTTARKKKPTKRAASVSIRLPSAVEHNADCLTLKQVAFHLDGDGRPSWLDAGCLPYAEEYMGRKYLLGTIIRRDTKTSKTRVLYTVEWSNTTLGTTPLDLSIVLPAIELAKAISAAFIKAKTQGTRESLSRVRTKIEKTKIRRKTLLNLPIMTRAICGMLIWPPFFRQSMFRGVVRGLLERRPIKMA